jgi:DNA-binding NtrC family response regulator
MPVFAAVADQRSKALLSLLERGFTDFFVHPFRAQGVVPRLLRFLRPSPSAEPEWLARVRTEMGLRGLIGRSPVFLEQIRQLPLLARSDASVLIRGETGTGKELVARALHYLGPRADGPFVPVNCGALPFDLVESELFGHERAAFTGAVAPRAGLVEESDRGTLFLDEIDSLTPAAQVKLLRFLQDREFRRLGSNRARSSDARVLAATNTDPEEAVARGRLRSDVYYRLNVLQLELPPLRERREDIVPLAEHFLRRNAANCAVSSLSAEARRTLVAYDWPGNVRELEHAIQRALVLGDGRPLLSPKELGLPSDAALTSRESFAEAKQRIVERFEREYVSRALAATAGNVAQAARQAQRSRRGFWNLVQKHGIDVARYRAPDRTP